MPRTLKPAAACLQEGSSCSGYRFDGWERPELIDRNAYWIAQLSRVPRPTEPPRTWLCRVGWRKHGLLRVDDVPGATATDVFGVTIRPA